METRPARAERSDCSRILQELLGHRRPASLRSCVLLDKPYRRQVDVKVDYMGLTAPDTFIVGYGLDYQEKYRNLPYLARLHDRVYREGGVVSPEATPALSDGHRRE
jgi:hypothetical protein